MFIIKITYLAELAEIDKYVQAHRDFLDMHYQTGQFLASGPMTPRTGGIIVALGSNKERVEEIFKDDPYQKAGVASYEVIEFTAVKCLDQIKSLMRDPANVNL